MLLAPPTAQQTGICHMALVLQPCQHRSISPQCMPRWTPSPLIWYCRGRDAGGTLVALAPCPPPKDNQIGAVSDPDPGPSYTSLTALLPACWGPDWREHCPREESIMAKPKLHPAKFLSTLCFWGPMHGGNASPPSRGISSRAPSNHRAEERACLVLLYFGSPLRPPIASQVSFNCHSLATDRDVLGHQAQQSF